MLPCSVPFYSDKREIKSNHCLERKYKKGKIREVINKYFADENFQNKELAIEKLYEIIDSKY